MVASDDSRARKRLDVLVKVDVGFHRCGIDPESPRALDIVREVARSQRPAVSRAAEPRRTELPREVERGASRTIAEHESAILRDAGRARCATPASTSPKSASARRRPRDSSTASAASPRCGPATTCSSTARRSASARRRSTTARWPIVSTVVSRPAPSRVIFDAGSKTLTSDGVARFRHVDGSRTGVSGPRHVDARPVDCHRAAVGGARRRRASSLPAVSSPATACASSRITPAS